MALDHKELHTTEKHSTDVRTLSEAELDEVSGGGRPEPWEVMMGLGVIGLGVLLTCGTLDPGLHK
jgi:hypothetical protein